MTFQHRCVPGLPTFQRSFVRLVLAPGPDLAGKMAAQEILLDRTAVSRVENLSRYVMDYEAVALVRCLKYPWAGFPCSRDLPERLKFIQFG